jgi:carbamoyl-phosphate synthase large subunit
MEHIEAAGVHSGDSACVLPPQGVSRRLVDELREQTAALAAGLGAIGLLNVQFAVRDGDVHVIEANPRASRTVPFVAKATGVPLVRHAVRLMLGEPLEALGLPPRPPERQVAVKEAVLPFGRFPGEDPVLGPEMRATGESMGIGPTFAAAFAKAQRGAGHPLPRAGVAFLSARDPDKGRMAAVARRLAGAGLDLVATAGTAAALAAEGLAVAPVAKVSEGSPHAVDLIAGGGVDLVVATPSGPGARPDGAMIRRAAVRASIPFITTIEAAEVAAAAIAGGREGAAPVALQDLAGGPSSLSEIGDPRP